MILEKVYFDENGKCYILKNRKNYLADLESKKY